MIPAGEHCSPRTASITVLSSATVTRGAALQTAMQRVRFPRRPGVASSHGLVVADRARCAYLPFAERSDGAGARRRRSGGGRSLAAAADHEAVAVAAAGKDRHRRSTCPSSTSTALKRRQRTVRRLHHLGRKVDLLPRRRQLGELPARRQALPAGGDRPALRRLPRRALARHPPLPLLRRAARTALRDVRAQGLRRGRARQPRRLGKQDRLQDRPAPPSCASTAGSPARSTGRGMAVALKNDGRQADAAGRRLRLRDRRAVLPVPRMRLLQAVRAARQGGLRGRVRARARAVLRNRARYPLQRDRQVRGPLRQALAPLLRTA